MNHFTNQSNGSHRGHSLMGRAMLRRFALFPMMLLMLLFLPAGMVAQPGASSSKYIATYDSVSATLTFKKYEGESLPSNSAWVKDSMQVGKPFVFHIAGIKHVVLDESFETFSPTTLNNFLANLAKLETITGLEYLNTENVTDMSSLFYGCGKLTSLDLSHFNTANVTNMSSMFKGCTGLTSLDVTNFNTANVTDMSYMFFGCRRLKEIYVSDKFVTNSVQSSVEMFLGCSSLSGDIDWTSDKADDKTYAKTGGGYFRDKAYDNRPFVKYADGTLTFRCGYKKIFGDKEYALNSGENSPAWKAKSGNITQVVFDASFANARPTTCFKWFSSFSKLTQVKGVENLNTENVTNMGNMFAGCSSLASLDVTHFNTANVTNMNSMFYLCSSLASLDVTHFNTANVTNMNSMFYLCSSLTSLDVTHFNTEKVTDMRNMFGDCNELTSLDVTHFNTEKVTDMYNMFGNCWRLASLDVTLFNTANVTNMDFMFFDCLALTSLDVTHFNTAKVEGMSGMFAHCSSLTSLDVTHFNTEKVTNMSQMFNGCACLASLDVTNFNTANVSNMEYMFCDGSNLKAIYASDKFVTNAVTKSSGMFEGCKSLSGELAWTSDKVADKTYATLDGGYFREKGVADRPWVKYADGTLTFRYGFKRTVDINRNEYALNSGDSIPAWYKPINKIPRVVFDASFANARPTTCYAWFQDFQSLKQIEGIENLNTENVTNMAYMFRGCRKLAELDVTHFNTANVTSMSNMFCDCSNLTSLDVTHFNTENVKDMSRMFYFCSNLTSLDVTHFNTANVKNMSNMFLFCVELTSLDVTHFNTANVTDMSDMFHDCKSLAELDLTHFNTANVRNMKDMFLYCQTLTTIYVSDEFVITNITKKDENLFYGCFKLKGAIDFDEYKTNSSFANYKTGYFTKLVGKNGDEKIGAAGNTLATDNLVLEDSKDFVAYEPFAAKAASYSRTVEGTTWATLCLPFEVSLQNQNFRAFKLLSADDAAETVELEEIKTSIAAGTPVIIKMNDGATQLNFTVANKEIANEVKTAETANGNYQLQGLYTQKVFSKDTDNNCYIVKGDKLMNPAKLLGETPTEFVGSKPFRAYMEDKSSAPVAGARMFSIRIGDGTTAIKQLEADAADAADGKAEYYDLQGHRLQDLQKGVNIVKRGGKTMKVVIK